MKVTVLAMVVAVLVSTSTVEYGEAINSEEICEQIRSNKLDILTMGARGKSLDDAHFYMLAKGGYMFKVPLSNLRVDATNKTTSITIDREYIRADALFNVSRDLFTRQDSFFFISNQNQDIFLGQITISKYLRIRTFQLYDLNSALSKRHHPKDIDVSARVKYHTYMLVSIGIDSSTAYGCFLLSNKLYWHKTFEVDNKDELNVKFEPLKKWMMELSGTTDIVTAFYHKENPKKDDGYYYFLDTNGLVTVSRRKSPWDFPSTLQALNDLYRDRFEVNLNSFVVCHFKSTTTNLQTIDPQTTDPPTSDWTYWTIMALGLGIIFVLGGLAIYFYVAMRKEKAKRRDLKKKNRQNMFNLSSLASSNLSSSNLNSSNISSGTSSSNASSNAFTLTSNPTTSSMASKGSSVLQSIKSGISSLLSRNKTEQANTVAKAKNSKAKAKKPKSPK